MGGRPHSGLVYPSCGTLHACSETTPMKDRRSNTVITLTVKAG